MKILGIAGGSASGKTTLANLIEGLAKKDEIQILSIDSYYKDTSNLTFKQRELINFDNPDSLEFSLLHKHLAELLKGKTIKVPIYDFAKHNRSSKVKILTPPSLLIVDGIFALLNPDLRDLYDKSIFIEADTKLMYQRKLDRDIRERGRTKEFVKFQWETTVLPMYEKFCLPTKKFADEVIDGGKFGVGEARKVVDALI